MWTCVKCAFTTIVTRLRYLLRSSSPKLPTVLRLQVLYLYMWYLYRADCSHSCLGNAFTITVTAFAIFVKDLRCKLAVTFCLYKYRISTCGICKRPFAARRGSKMRVQQLLSYLSCDSCKGHSAVVCTGYCRLQSLYL